MVVRKKKPCINKEVVKHLPLAYQRFYSILKEAGIELEKVKVNSKKEGD